jgi:hypothetical protein
MPKSNMEIYREIENAEMPKVIKYYSQEEVNNIVATYEKAYPPEWFLEQIHNELRLLTKKHVEDLKKDYKDLEQYVPKLITITMKLLDLEMDAIFKKYLDEPDGIEDKDHPLWNRVKE